MIGGAGDNALHYLLDGPQYIDCVDINAAQIALMRFKKVLLEHEKLGALNQLFRLGSWSNSLSSFLDLLDLLPQQSAQFWHSHHTSFTQPRWYNSFYYQGTSGFVAAILRVYFEQRNLYKPIMDLFAAPSLKVQQSMFDNLEPNLWSGWLEFLMGQKYLLPFLGVPQHQIQLMLEGHTSVFSYVQRVIRQVFRERSLSNNYYWYVYLNGAYTRACTPPYLKPENWADLTKNIHRLHIKQQSLENLLLNTKMTYTHFILLDHLDWISDQQQLQTVWRLILNKTRSGTKILFRSASPYRSQIPSFVQKRVIFRDDLTEPLHHQDRVGTYMSTHLAEVK
jgi:S-adenosylmethionine-diacylglycerol 3-amino-3-carboxypropyl transferase